MQLLLSPIESTLSPIESTTIEKAASVTYAKFDWISLTVSLRVLVITFVEASTLLETYEQDRAK